nr:AAA family ATPase [Streptomyces sp. NRRL F-5702]
MNPGTLFPLGQVFQASQHRQASRLHTPVPRHPVRTPSRHDPTLARSASTRRSNREDTERDQSATGDAFEVLHSIADKRLRRGLLTVIDATNLRGPDRPWLLDRARHWQRPLVAVLFDVPLAIVQAQNAGRARVVPSDVVSEFHALLPTVDRLRDEGWDTVHLASTIIRTGR